MRTEGVNISIKKATLLISVALMFFFLLGACSAVELDNVTSTQDSNLIVDNDELSFSELKDSSDNSILKQDNEDLLESVQTSESEKLSDNGNSTSNVTPVKTSLQIYAPHYSKTNTVFKVSLKDANGSGVANKTISLKVNSKTYKGTTGSNGIAYIAAASLKQGTYSVTATYKGDAEHIKSALTKKVKVASSISASNMAKTYGVSKYYTATFWKDNGKLTNATVKFTVNGKTYSVKTDSNGAAKIATNLNPGKYTVKIYNSYSKETLSKTITVKKDSSKFTGAKNTYILPKTKYTYSVTLKSGQNAPLKNTKVYFTYNSKKVTAKTDANGKAKITIPGLSKGTYKLSYQYKGNSKYKAASGSKKLYVKDSTTTLKSSALKAQYNDGSMFSVKATSSGKALANKTIKFTLNGKTTTANTDSNGVAKLAVGNLKPNTYTVKYSYSTAGLKDYNIKSNSIQVIRQTVSLTASDLVMKYNDGSSYQVTIKNKTGTNLKGAVVKFTLNGKSTKATTDEKGIAKLNITEAIGYYPIDMQVVDSSYYTSSKVSKHVLVNGTKFQANDMTISVNTAGTFSVKLIDGQSKAVANKAIKFTLNGKTQSVKTDSSGIAKLAVSGLSKGTYTVTYTDGSASGSSKINIVDQVTLKDIITASQNVKKYIENNAELPNTVTIGGVTYSTATYVYLASQAIINLKNNKKTNINIISVNNPSSPKAASNLGNLYDYLSVAKSIVNTANSKGIIPDSVNSNIGEIGYKGWVYAAARVVAFYDDNAIMPNYVTIKTYSASTSSSLNSKNTITNLAAYLKSSTNCQVNNAKIKSLVNSLTSGLTSDLAKARAIYNYVRDSISYSFYYDTKYGAVGTLNAKNGNCVDQSHLLIAMYRTAGLAARYVHGTCTFSSGTYGHVWTQVLIGDTWIVADATSVRNSFGNVVNWNNNNYQLKGYYASIAF